MLTTFTAGVVRPMRTINFKHHRTSAFKVSSIEKDELEVDLSLSLTAVADAPGIDFAVEP